MSGQAVRFYILVAWLENSVAPGRRLPVLQPLV